MSHAGVNSPAIGIEPADNDVVDSHQRGEDGDRSDESKRSVTRDRKGETDDGGFARAPIAIKDGGRARDVDIERAPNVGRNHGRPRFRKRSAGRKESGWLVGETFRS